MCPGRRSEGPPRAHRSSAPSTPAARAAAARSCGSRAAHAGRPSPQGPSSSTRPAACARPAPASSSDRRERCAAARRVSSSNSASATATPDALSLAPGEKPDSAMSTAAAKATSSTTVGTSWTRAEPRRLDAAEARARRARDGDPAGREPPARPQQAPPAVVEHEAAPGRAVGGPDHEHRAGVGRLGQHVLGRAAREQRQRPAGGLDRQHGGARAGDGQTGGHGDRRQQAPGHREQAAERQRRVALRPHPARPDPRLVPA